MRLFVIAAAAVSACALTAQAGLTHRYSFDTNADDSVGTAHGTLVNSATVSGGVLNFNNPNFSGPSTTGGYLNISPSVLPTTGSMTIEQWFTFGGSGFFTEAYAFSNNANDANQPNATNGQYLLHTISNPQNNAGANTGGSSIAQSLAGYGGGAESRAYHTTPGFGAGGGGYLDDGGTYMAATVIDGNAGTLSYYINGILQSTIPAIPLSSYSFTNLYLGRSPFGGDNRTSGVVDEFRIYDEARNAITIAGDYAAGPNQLVPEPTSLAVAGIAGMMLRRRR